VENHRISKILYKRHLAKFPFMIKALNKVGIEENILNMIKGIYEKLTAYIIFSH
jgi:hypothetical protein